jgi:hypothetical protein
MKQNPTQETEHITIDANQAANMIALLNLLEQLTLNDLSLEKLASLDPAQIEQQLSELKETLDKIQSNQEEPKRSLFNRAMVGTANALKPVAFLGSLSAAFLAGTHHEEIKNWIHKNTAPTLSEPN